MGKRRVASGVKQWTLPEGVAPDALPAILARNLWQLMRYSPDMQSQLAVSRHAKIGQATVDRILRCEGTTRIDSLERIAKAFGVQPYLLLRPDVVWDPNEIAYYAELRSIPPSAETVDLI